MARSTGQEFVELYGTLIVLALALALAILVTPLFLVGGAAWIGYRLYRDSPARAERIARRETMELYEHARRARVRLSPEEIDDALGRRLPSGTPRVLREGLLEIGREIFRAEGLEREIPPPPALHNTVEAARYRDRLARAGEAGHDREMSLSALHAISESLAAIARRVPPLEGDVLVEITQFVDEPGRAVAEVIAPFFAETGYGHFKPMRDRLNANYAATHRTTPVLPEDYRGDDVVQAYLGGTPLARLFELRTPFAIPEAVRFEHAHIVAGSGHGKTQTLQFHIARDLEDVARGEKSVVVIDSQGDLIRNVLAARTVDPERIVVIDPEDIDWPVCLNLFSVGQERLAGYDALERERLTNSIIELYDFVLGSLLQAGMTAKQGVVFRYVTRLMLHIPDATIHTLRELLEPGGADRFRVHIEKLDGTARHFFESEFDGKEFEQTKRQVVRRLYQVLENRTFERMFSHPASKLDMFAEINAGKLILINTSKSLLKESGTEIFGRFFIALIAQAAQERAVLPDWERTPTLVYIDEAQDYFDRTIAVILSQARKYRVGMVLAHQYLGQLDAKLQEAIEANTSIKMAGGVSARDARALAGQMNADADLVQRQPKGSFAVWVRGVTRRAVSISFPFFVLENLPQASAEEIAEIRRRSRERYAEPLQRDDEYEQADLGEGKTPDHPPPEDDGGDGPSGEGENLPSADEAEPPKTTPPRKKKPRRRPGAEDTDPSTEW
ncbi:ATP-binding protein [Albimonas sp. CAU 1670]|uniref:ATP-binding protein n=1 Tax=Albimonas sp. CAU 1670 TaxID=3032599 RepID=UPI0023DA57F2|nr:ATP-binding protein [Albimonas sp. CAU 1670]MDF2233151.1 ATP-binding protein [Albimonas sp. CAU 1670]